MTKIAVLLLAVLIASSFSIAQSGSITGTVVDGEGAVVPNAVITIHWDPSGTAIGLKDNLGIKEDLHATTDRSGRVSLEIPPGFYDVFVSWPGFSPMALKVRVKAGKPAAFKVRLKFDRLVGAEVADDFSYLK